ncbi:MAG: hypothetical protein FWF22_01745, partial [Treponema sp.]|nr:hypothetical protein [Treponema sp.]
LKPTDMLRFGYLMMNMGRWGEKQLVPKEYAEHCSKKSPYNPHFPYSLQFNVNTGSEIAYLPADAFWKAGSGGHCLYIVPSLKLVVWKFGGRDDQYSMENTGFKDESGPEAGGNVKWTKTVDYDTAVIETLKMVIDSI